MGERREKLPRWRCHKVVHADKIVSVISTLDLTWTLACGAHIAVSNELANRVNAPSAAGGYYVRYEDGYESWSPREAFEAGYKRLK